MRYKLQVLTSEYLDIVLSWRNQDRIRKNMYNEKVITMEEHQAWFQHILQSKKDVYLLFYMDEIPTGLVYFNGIDHQHEHCYWGFYIGREDATKGSGTIMATLAFDFAYKKLKMNKIYGEILAYNFASVKFHEKLGFKQEGLFKSHIKKDDNFIDVYTYGLLSKDWYEFQRPFILNDLVCKGIDVYEDSYSC
ncbi:UDP-4-amino-4,6-dideoxy-N-acetyl-beta-L-altrosamine N-acetyltransferase [Fredinandcohnia onubensis]|uniref:UDP-4-amino-4, 6-dideoxy-N-acetyl-beta-L-altrosamine N-acetyltransferase n=1 Tax=Fredinandcohnia onubensis TaxID=1571209 RepID=UPI0015D489C3|nr:UDP-4-amino-4,6-dideoxy-N-acetyl-beta-L-altrosamine N-acetyltransferase [Fredinandcohnia onubensis]